VVDELSESGAEATFFEADFADVEAVRTLATAVGDSTAVSYPQIESLPRSMNPTETRYLQM
jgi:hypothetical protein